MINYKSWGWHNF